MDVGEKIEIALKARGMSQKELSEKAHTTEASISRYINGERYPKWQIAKRIADVLDVSLDWLADRKTEQTDLVKESPSLVKDLVNAFCEDGTWLERQGVYTLTLAEAKQRAVDIIEAVSRKDTADTPQTDCGWGEPNED